MLYKKAPCPDCNGKGYLYVSTINSISCYRCEHCGGDGQVARPMTNGDLIRLCTNEQLAYVWDKLKQNAVYSGGNYPRLLSDIYEDYLVWLNKTADKNDLKWIFDFVDESDYPHPFIATDTRIEETML